MRTRGRYERRRTPRERVRATLADPLSADIALTLLLVGTAFARYRILTDRHAPATVDSGNWLAFGHAIMGNSPRSSSIVYPPLVPLLMAGMTRIFGPIVAVGLLGSLTALLPAIAVYVALRALGLRWSAVALAALLAASASVGEAAAWGGFPQLIGLALVTAFLVALDRALERPRWQASVAVAVLFTLILLTSHFVAIFAVMAAGAVVGLALLASGPGRWRWLVARLPTFALCLLPVIAVFPIYAPLLAAIAGNRPKGTDTATATVGVQNLLETVEFTYREAPLVWRVLTLFAFFAPVAMRDRWRRPEWRLPVAGLVAIVVGTVLTHEARFLAFLPVVTVAAAGLWVLAGTDALPSPKVWLQTLGAGFVALILLIQATTGMRLFVDQREFYGIIQPGTFSGINWLRIHTTPDTTLGVSTVDDAPLGWWLEGYVRRPTYYASPLRWLSFPDELRRARVANSVFTPRFPDETSLPRAAWHGIDLLVVATGSNRYDPPRMRAFLRRHPQAVVYRNRDVIILRTSPGR